MLSIIILPNRRNLQHQPGPQTRVDVLVHPSLGTGNTHSQDMRTFVMFINEYMDENHPNLTDVINDLYMNHVYSSADTIRRWKCQMIGLVMFYHAGETSTYRQKD